LPQTALIVGGTRNLGPDIAQALLDAGYAAAVFHRGVTQSAALPAAVERLFGDRSDPGALSSAVGSRTFDVVIDTTLYNGPDAAAAARIFAGRTGRYVMLSTGQVYLVRLGPARPFAEHDYAGPLMPAPAASKFDLDNWSYGIHKRAAEDALRGAAGFPVTILRLPMVNSERDHFHRLRNYLARVRDGGPILVPDGPHLPLRHVYGKDVVRAAMLAIEAGIDGAINVGQDETLTMEDFLARLGVSAARIVRRSARELWERGLMPNCSHFSEPWMSSLDNRQGKQSLGLTYTPVDTYLAALIRDFEANPAPPPAGYAQRPRELELAVS
jgi:nucleoside-diphosphate-sugar epimerase